MRKMRSISSVLALTFIMTACFNVGTVGAKGNEDRGDKNRRDNINLSVSAQVYGNVSVTGEVYGKDELKEMRKAIKAKLMAERKAVKIELDKIHQKIAELGKQIEAAEKAGNEALVKELKAKQKLLKEAAEKFRNQLKQKRFELRAEVKESYTKEELEMINKVTIEIKLKNKGIKVLPVESVVSSDTTIKLDTPPVIKDGRTLVPVRALTEAYGAVIKWDDATRTVTIKQDAKVIILILDRNVALVDNKEVKIEVPAQVINSRTVIPLRFVVENLGLQVNWDSDTETIEIEK